MASKVSSIPSSYHKPLISSGEGGKTMPYCRNVNPISVPTSESF